MDKTEQRYHFLRAVRNNLNALGKRSNDRSQIYAGLICEAILLLAAIVDELHYMNERE